MNWHAPKGICTDCGRSISLRLDGTLRGHMSTDQPSGYGIRGQVPPAYGSKAMDWCDGSWEKPKEMSNG